jgi:hypothetical protein
MEKKDTDSEVASLLQLVDRRVKSWRLSAEVLQALENFRQSIPLHDENSVMASNHIWTTLCSSENNWEIVCVGIHCILRFLQELDSQLLIQNPDLAAAVTTSINGTIINLVTHEEPRVRNQLIRICKVYSRQEYVSSRICYTTISPTLLARIGVCWERKDTNFCPVMTVSGDSASGLTTMNLDDTTGWKDLESSLKCLQALIIGLARKRDTDLASEVSDEVFDLIIVKSAKHVNRYVRQSSHEFCKDLLEEWGSVVHATDGLLTLMTPLVAESLAVGLDEDWGQLRRVACLCAQQFFLVVSPLSVQQYYGTLLPRLCLNRYPGLCIIKCAY